LWDEGIEVHDRPEGWRHIISIAGGQGMVVVSGSVVVVVASVVVVVAPVVVVVASVVVVGDVVVVVVELVVVVPGLVVVVAWGRVVVVVTDGGRVVGGVVNGGVVGGPPGSAGVEVVAPGPGVPLRGGRPAVTGSVVVVGADGVTPVIVIPTEVLVGSGAGVVVPGAARISSTSLGSQALMGRRSGWAISPTLPAST
jgi:hypothetical protein